MMEVHPWSGNQEQSFCNDCHRQWMTGSYLLNLLLSAESIFGFWEVDHLKDIGTDLLYIEKAINNK